MNNNITDITTIEEECDLLIKNEKIKKLLEKGNENKGFFARLFSK